MKRRALARLGLVFSILTFLSAAGGASATTVERVQDFVDPIGVTSHPEDPDRLFVTQKGGEVILFENGVSSVFLDISSLVYPGEETGLLSIALAPDFATTGRLYAFYVRSAASGEGDLQIDEFTATGNHAPLSSRRPVLTIPLLGPDPPSIHNGGQLQFGPDDLLYITVGDGDLAPAFGDEFEAGQDPDLLWGKVLRIDPVGDDPGEYSIPEDNPFVGRPGADEVWSLGLRNPWRLTFDRQGGAMVMGDVGQNSWEEINYVSGPDAGRGVNFGWDCREGRHPFDPGPAACTELTDPVFEYPHPAAGPASVTSGYIVRDPALCGLEGRLLYADVFTGELRSLAPGVPDAAGDAPVGVTADFPVSFGEDAAGRLYVVSHFHPGAGERYGTVYRLTASEGQCGAEPRTCAGREATLSGARKLTGTRGADVIVGTSARDRIKGRGGRDLICADGGDDVVTGGGGADRLKGGSGRDLLRGGRGDDRCAGGPQRDELRSC